MTDATTATVAVSETAPGPQHGSGDNEVRSLWSDAWRQLRKNPLFWISAVLIVLFVLMAVLPQLFTRIDPNSGSLRHVRESWSGDHWFGTDKQGRDIYARTVYGARASIIVGLLTTVCTTLVGGTLGILAGYLGGWLDALLMRVTDIFFAIPMLLGGILFMASFPSDANTGYWSVVGKVVLVMTVFGWPGIARLMRSSVLQVKSLEYVQAARALGARPGRIILGHILPNAVAPVIVVATINLGAYIATEAALSFLGIGLVPPTISWGVAISDALDTVRTSPHILLFPSLFLSLAVLAFILLGDAVRDALDPKTR
ncbi:ABC transporter permease [Arsenicicoccus sp. oral taxon 190]|uniref:ABC transporter permease n=1 Tax=Arsenicicoccus sp. oral taxon 190 TaxID=1658671 RepID=UPI000679EB63|nr:ABC transporter permease [Arsenicicoccus sp. oral taxon 190]AKT51695.1 peptide ABC transporter permease [Arsenicicoccus sp. oral taxon 190]